MGKICLLLLCTALLAISQAGEVLLVELEWFQGSLRKVSEQTIEKEVKRSRSAERGGRSGAASHWYWELVTSGGERVESRSFADPTILCTGDHSAHVILDSTRFTVELLHPRSGATLRVYNDGEAGASVVGSIMSERRSTPLATFALEGGE